MSLIYWSPRDPQALTTVVPTGDSALDTDNIQAALDSDFSTVLLGPGTFVLQAGVNIPAGKVLLGANAILQRQPQVATSTDTALVSGVTVQFVVASAAGLKVGDDLGFDGGAANISNGTSRITAITGNTITVDPAVEITDAGPGTVVFTTSKLVRLNDDSRIEGVVFDGNRANNPIGFWQTTGSIQAGPLVGPGTADRSRIENCRFINEAGEGIETDGADDIVIQSCTFSAIDGNGIHFGGTNRANVIACSFDQTNQRVAVGHADGCISFSNNVTEIVIDGCHFSDSPLAGVGGIDIPGNNHITIVSCDFELILGSPIEGTFPLNNAPTDVLIRGCLFQDCGTFRLEQTDAASVVVPERIVVEGCIFNSTFVVLQLLHNSKFINNIVDMTGTTTGACLGINGCFDCEFSGNILLGAQHGIFAGAGPTPSSGLKIFRNRCSGQSNAGSGITFSLDPAGPIEVYENTIIEEDGDGGTMTGIQIGSANAGDFISVVNNYLQLAPGPGTFHGINSDGTASHCLIQGNKIVSTHVGSNDRCIRVDGNDRVKNNDIICIAGFGVEVVGAALEPIVQGNAVSRGALQTAIQISTATSIALVINNQHLGNLVDNSVGTAVLRDNDAITL